MNIWFHACVGRDPIPCAIASRFDDASVRVLPIGLGDPTLHPWILHPRLFLGDAIHPDVNIVCASPGTSLGTVMTLENGVEVYKPMTAFSGLWVPDTFNVAIVYPLHDLKAVKKELDALAKFNLRIVLAEEDLIESLVEMNTTWCRNSDEVMFLIKTNPGGYNDRANDSGSFQSL